MTTDPRALDGVSLATYWSRTYEGASGDLVVLTFAAPHGRGADAAEALRSLVNGALHLARNPFVVTRMERPPTDANGMPVEVER